MVRLIIDKIVIMFLQFSIERNLIGNTEDMFSRATRFIKCCVQDGHTIFTLEICKNESKAVYTCSMYSVCFDAVDLYVY